MLQPPSLSASEEGEERDVGLFHRHLRGGHQFALLFARRAGYDLADFGVDRPEVLDALETALEAR